MRTTIHRLRAFLDPRGDWVTITAEGYGLSVPLHVVGAAAGPVHHDVVFLDDDALDVALPVQAARADDGAVGRSILDELARRGPLSVPAIAKALDTSPSTALRALRELVASKRVKRTGAARATRYRLR